MLLQDSGSRLGFWQSYYQEFLYTLLSIPLLGCLAHLDWQPWTQLIGPTEGTTITATNQLIQRVSFQCTSYKLVAFNTSDQ